MAIPAANGRNVPVRGAAFSWVDLLTDAAERRHQLEGAHSSRMGPMIELAVVLPALLFSVATVVLAAREERALRPDLALRRVRQSGDDGPPDGGSMRKVR